MFQVSFCGSLTEIDESKLETNNFIVYSAHNDIADANYVVRCIGKRVGISESQFTDATQESRPSESLKYSESGDQIRRHGGTIVCIVDNTTETNTDRLESMVRQKSFGL